MSRSVVTVLTRHYAEFIGLVGIAAAVTALIVLGDFLPHSTTVSAVIAATICLVLFCAAWLVRRTIGRVDQFAWHDPAQHQAVEQHVAIQHRLARLRQMVDAAAAEPRYAVHLHATLSQLAARRLLTHRHITMSSDPAAAAAALGPELTAYLGSEPDQSTPTLKNLTRIIERIEEL